MPNVATLASGSTFAAALLIGLAWGVAAATVAGGFAMALATTSLTRDVATALRVTLETTVWTAIAASILALFPIGPVAGVIGWQFYRRGIVASWVYVLVGAVSALVAPVLVLLISIETSPYATGTNLAVVQEGVAMLITAAFPILGAFAGLMTARVLARTQSS